ncbi:MAG: hypothetical protein AAF399_15540 [Bacteroidota bacterium]
MSDSWIPLAYYEDPALAQRHNEFLRDQGISSVLKFPDGPVEGHEDAQAILIIPELEFAAANDHLDEFEQTLEGRPATKGDRSMLSGGVTGMVGILASLGQYGEETGMMLGFAYSMVFVGGAIFLRGLLKNRTEEGENV